MLQRSRQSNEQSPSNQKSPEERDAAILARLGYETGELPHPGSGAAPTMEGHGSDRNAKGEAGSREKRFSLEETKKYMAQAPR